MALSRTTYTLSVATAPHGTGGFTTGAFTPPNSSLLVVAVFAHANVLGADISADMTIADSETLTWTSRVVIGSATADGGGLRIWTAPVTTGASMTITVDCGARDVWKYHVHRYAYEGYNTSSPTGATASAAVDSPADDETITLSASPASTSEVVAAMGEVFGGDTHSVTVGTGWTEIYEDTVAGDFSLSQSQIRTGSTSTTVVWDDVDAGTAFANPGLFAALEIKVASAGITTEYVAPVAASGGAMIGRRYI